MFYNCIFGVSICVRIRHTYLTCMLVGTVYSVQYTTKTRVQTCTNINGSSNSIYNVLYLYSAISSLQPTNYYTALFNRSHRLLECCVWIRMLHIHATPKHFLFDGMFVIVVVIISAVAITFSSIPWKLISKSIHDLCITQLHCRKGNAEREESESAEKDKNENVRCFCLDFSRNRYILFWSQNI